MEPSLLQSLLVCECCGYNLYRNCSSKGKSKRYYYRCPGSDPWRNLKQANCSCRPIRQDFADRVVWEEVIGLLENPHLLQAEITRRLQAARQADPAQQRRSHLGVEQTRVEKSIDRVLQAYQESLLSLDELRERIGPLRRQQGAIRAELEALETETADQQRYLRLVESLAPFQARLRSQAESMDIKERQKIVRLLVKEVVVGENTFTIRHCLPIPPGPNSPPSAPAPPLTGSRGESSVLCTRRLGVLARDYRKPP
jgi:site-specific DNA recombinase